MVKFSAQSEHFPAFGVKGLRPTIMCCAFTTPNLFDFSWATAGKHKKYE